MFQLLILGCLSKSNGMLWRKNIAHVITVEVLRTQALAQNPPKQVAMCSSDHELTIDINCQKMLF